MSTISKRSLTEIPRERKIRRAGYADMSKCKERDCRFLGLTDGKPTCDYCIITGHMRGCQIEDCDINAPGDRGNRLRMQRNFNISEKSTAEYREAHQRKSYLFTNRGKNIQSFSRRYKES